MEKSEIVSSDILIAKKKLSSNFFKKGIAFAVLSGMCYGFYSAFLLKATRQGIWSTWYDPAQTVLSAFTVTYVLGAIGSAINDSCSAIWSFAIFSSTGKLKDFFRCLKSKPGMVMIAAAIIGGPISSTADVVALQMAGPTVIPITALCPAIGAILGRMIFKQKLNGRMVFGIMICVTASALIGFKSMGESTPHGQLLGCIIAFIAALGWGIEGCIAGFGTALIDYHIGITIRQTTSAVLNLTCCASCVIFL